MVKYTYSICYRVIDTTEIVKIFDRLIATEYLRKTMEEFSYLKENISLDWYWQLMVFLINLLASGFAFVKFTETEHRFRRGF